MPPIIGRSLLLFIACAVFFQLILFLKSSPPSSSRRQHSPYPRDNANDHSPPPSRGFSSSQQRSHDPGRNRHPTVPLTLKDFEVLDELADKIAATEAYRVFEAKEVGRIRGTAIKNNPVLVRQIRDQIHCWTTHGSWVRQDKQLAWTKHLGDSRFAKCDKTFMKALDREGNGHYVGEYDRDHDRLLVREAVKYKWVPDEKLCGSASSASPGQHHVGLDDARAEYQPFDKEKFCRALGRRETLLVGDITQYQLHDVMLSAFKSSVVCYGEMGCVHHRAHEICPSGAGVKYARNDVLSVPWAINPEDEDYPSASTVERPWAIPEVLQKIKIVILNRGLIWRPDEVFLNELVHTMKHLWSNFPDTLVIYRATHPTSPNCTKFKHQGEDEAIGDMFGARSVVQGTILQRPLQQPPKREETHQTDRPEYRPILADIQRQNRMAKAIVEASGGIFLDTEAMFARRLDGRMGDGDCARFCAPGPLDAYADLLYNTFRILEV
ncbi:hypothetical protein BGX31_007296 [Mortierella sp. GBA43]|nr:hypothetical protein BGX31_007296 [Mortierella sp. GBA43]